MGTAREIAAGPADRHERLPLPGIMGFRAMLNFRIRGALRSVKRWFHNTTHQRAPRTDHT
jgi:hypothetical protein